MSLEGTELHLVDSVDEAQEMFRWLGTLKEPLLGADTEGTGLSPETDRVRLAQFSDDRVGWAIPFERWGGVVEELVSKWDGEYVMHNASYDVAMFRKEGINVPTHRVHDTRLMGHVLEPTESTALKNQASRHVDPRAAALQRRLDEVMTGWTWANIPIVREGDLAVYWQYGALDPILTYQLRDVHYPRVTAEAPRAYELELGVSWVVEQMERRGSKVDREYTALSSQRFSDFVGQAEMWCQVNYGVKPGSAQAVIEILQREGFQFTKRTDSGALSLDRDVLESIDHPLAQTVLTRRRAQKLQSTYLRRFLEYSEYDGYLHPKINSIGGSKKSVGASEGLYGVRTGRMSMDTPNLQNLPRRNRSNPMADVVRNCIITRYFPDLGSLLMCDFDQIEMRVLAHLARDRGMIQAFLTDVDFFTSLARSIYSEPSIEKSDPRRQTTKNAGYAKAYGAGVERFAETAGIPLEQGRVFLDTFDQLYPGVRWLQSEVDKVSKQREAQEGVAYVRSPLTGRRHTADPGREYALINYLIQGTAGEILKIKLLELDAAGLGKYMILPVHDEVILDVPTEDQAEAIATLRDVMNDDTLLSVPITASVARGLRWGEKEDILL